MGYRLLSATTFLFIGVSLFAQNNRAPLARAGQDTVYMSDGAISHHLDGSASTDPDDNIVNYYWVLEGDTIAHDIQADVIISSPENRIKLIVEDDSGSVDDDIVTVFIGHPTNHGLNRIPFRNGDFPLFASGMNIAWRNFANDLNEFTEDDELFFRDLMDAIKNNGGNALRWWLHTNGSNSPQVSSSGQVTGVEFENILAMKRVLDIAYEKEVVFSMCLWSFDMLQKGQGQDEAAMKLLLEDSANIQSYIDNALIPILDKIGDHPAIFTWEIFNEPEGMSNQFGWTSGGKTDMSNVQTFVNMTAGAIHRHTPTALVSNGSWSFRASTDIEGNKNYYSDSALVAQGGDKDGTLDFYQVHYYSEHAGNEFSPFHRPASHWGLNKPIVIGEFPADTLDRRADPDYSTSQAYQIAVNHGYAGVMSWAWTDNQFNEDFNNRTAKGMQIVASMIPDAVDINNTGIENSGMPEVVAAIEPIKRIVDESTLTDYDIDLAAVFKDKEDGGNLTFELTDNSNADVAAAAVHKGIVTVSMTDQPGHTILGISAQDSDNWPASTQALIMNGSTELKGNNLAYFTTINTSNHAVDHFPEFVTDADPNTSWETKQSGNQWLQMDFGKATELNFIGLNWRNDFAEVYQIERSDDGIDWEIIGQISNGNGDKDVFVFDEPITTHQLRLSLERNRYEGYEIKEWTVMNVQNNQAPELITTIESYMSGWSMTEDVGLYVLFKDIFNDETGLEYLSFEVENTDETVVEAFIPIHNRGVGLDFKRSSLPGTATITITATDPFGASTRISFDVVITNDLLSIDKQSGIHVYPNPVTDFLTIDEDRIDQMTIFNMQGQAVMNVKMSQTQTVDLRELTSGYYLLHLIQGEQTNVIKIIKK
jgi:hypothetical protein